MNKREQKQAVDDYLDAAERQRDALRQARNLLAEAKRIGREAEKYKRKVDDFVADGMEQVLASEAVTESMFRPLPRWNKETVRHELYDTIDELD